MKVVVTGMGVISSLGNSVDDMFNALVENRTGVKAMPDWQVHRGLHSFLGAPAMPYDEKVIPRAARRSMSRMSEMAVLATQQALTQANLHVEPANPRMLLAMGSTSGSPETLETYFRKLFERGGPEGQLSTSFFKVMNHSVAANVAVAMGFSGPVISPSSACSTSSQAAVLGWEMIRSGLYDVVVVGGADELHYTSTAVFDIVLAASRGYNDRPTETPRPFDQARDGLVVSEGAAVLVMESEAHAKRREAPILGEIAGGSYYCDGQHMSQPQADSMAMTMRLALERAGVKAHEIGYVNAHATGTVLGDIEEAQGTAAVFGDKVPISSLKAHFGHSLAVCGTLEIIATLKMMHRGCLIPTRNLTEIDPKCAGIQHLQQIRETPVRAALSNNFAFGGMNTSLVVLAP